MHNPHPLCLVVYHNIIPVGFVPTVVGHGNSKSNKPFFATLSSTSQLIKSECSSIGPKEVVASVSSNVGGIIGANYPGELPRNEVKYRTLKKGK